MRRLVAVAALAVAGSGLLLLESRAGAAPAPQPYGSCAYAEALPANPAAGSGSLVAITVPAGHYYDLASVQFVNTTAAGGASRNVTLEVRDGAANAVWSQGSLQNISSTVVYNASTSVALDANAIRWALPGYTLQPTWTVRIVMSSPQLTDQLSGVRMVYCDGTSASAPGLQTHVTVDNQPTTITVSNPQTHVTVDNQPTSITVSNPQTHVTIDGTVGVSGAITANVPPACAAAVSTTTDPTGNADERLSPCVQPVALDAPSDIPLFGAVALVLFAVGCGLAFMLFKGSGGAT